MNKHFEQLKSLSLYEWWLLFISSLLLPLTALSLHLFGFRRTQMFIASFGTSFSRKTIQKEDILPEGQMITRMVMAAANHGIYRANCLKKSLVLWGLLRRRGIESKLRIGVNKDESLFTAHSWVEINDIVLLDNKDTVGRYYTMM